MLVGVVAMAVVTPVALAATLSYPYSGAIDCSATYGVYSWCEAGNEYSSYGYAYRNCTDFVAWKLVSLGVPASKVKGLGNGGNWYDNALNNGLSRGSTPAVGAAVIQESSSAHPFGHVAYVTAVSGSTITIQEYNYYGDGTGDTRTGTATALGFSNEYVYFPSLMTVPPGGGSVSYPDGTFIKGSNSNTVHVMAGGAPLQLRAGAEWAGFTPILRYLNQ